MQNHFRYLETFRRNIDQVKSFVVVTLGSLPRKLKPNLILNGGVDHTVGTALADQIYRDQLHIKVNCSISYCYNDNCHITISSIMID